MKKLVYLGLGSNLGDRAQNLRQAAELIAAAGVTPLRMSSTHETEPMYVTGQPMFLNQVMEGETEVFPRTLLKRLKSIEQAMGRKRTVRNGPRPIDIDILFYGSAVIRAPELVVPHPRMEERRFVLDPLAEIAPDLRHPITKKTVREMRAAVRDK
ncbi:MAG: 2-amino-4-hydroxy-6-hydroxymethyldihydropteridine diphosphokinase [Bryobacteraceae bacterium]|nr:2-amino-4-hydroxy-6-hydroxymethyldihydropteridine diphosphokinase [Bryobacteraceae bacterium]